MIKHAFVKRIVLCLLLLAIPSNVFSQTTNCYPNPPNSLQDLVKKAAETIAQDPQNPTNGLTQFSRMMAWTVADASGGELQTLVTKLQRYRYVGETARTDQQVGASATSSGSTSAIEKPGLINLLGFAIERGAIQQEISDSTVTLSTSPYALVAAVSGDTPDVYSHYGWLGRFEASATFNLNDKDNPLENVRRQQLLEYTGKLRISGDRSTRSKKFQEFWGKNIKPLIDQRVNRLSGIISVVMNDANLKPLVDFDQPSSAYTQLKNRITDYLVLHPTNPAQADLEQLILCHLKTTVYDPIKSGALKPTDATLSALRAGFAGLSSVQAQIELAQKALTDFLEVFMKEGFLSTVAFTNHRDPNGSDYLASKLLIEFHAKPVDIILNAGVSTYYDPDPMKNQEKIRDADVAFSLEGSTRTPLRISDEDFSKITYSATFRYTRFKENEGMPGRKPDLLNFQAKLSIPVAAGLTIPIAYTYATATETSMKKENRFNIGLQLNVDKLFAFGRNPKQ